MANQHYYDQDSNHGYGQKPASFGPNYDAPLPPVPGASPFSDNAYAHQYRDASSERHQNPFADNSYPSRLPPQNYTPYSENIALQDQPQFNGQYGQQSPARRQSKLEDQPAGGLNDRTGGSRSSWRNGKWGLPYFVYFMTTVQVCVFIAEIAKNAQLTKSPIMIKPTFNPMIGPSVYVLINMGARFVPCMRYVENITALTSPFSWPCPNTTTSDPNSPTNMCTLDELCGFGAKFVPGTIPGSQATPLNQWWRFITPMFLHAGIIHIGFNMLLQLTLGRDMELAIGTLRFALVYICSGIFGFVLGGNYAANGIASTGASGALFGILALVILDITYSWKSRANPKRDLLFVLLEVVVSLVLGLLPGLDNFAHIGGFISGIVLGLCILHSPDALRRRTEQDAPPYTPVTASGFSAGENTAMKSFFKQPLGFFKGRKPLWWVWWLLRAGSLIAVIVGFILLLNNFYKYHVQCSWCKYLSCLPISNWCDLGNLQFTQTKNPARMF